MAYRETAQVKARKAAQRLALLCTAETLVREGGSATVCMVMAAMPRRGWSGPCGCLLAGRWRRRGWRGR